MDALELIGPRSRLSKATPEPRRTNHCFLKLSEFNDQLLEWVDPQTHWRPAVRNFTLGLLREGLHDRAITRDIEWGVPVPLEGGREALYVWFGRYSRLTLGDEGVGAERRQPPNAWEAWWKDPRADRLLQGKATSPSTPAICRHARSATAASTCPTHVPRTVRHDLRLERLVLAHLGVWHAGLPPTRHDPPAALRGLTAMMPETSDTDFTWAEYVRRNNDELVARWGNLVHRVLTLTHRHFDARVPGAEAAPSAESAALLARVDAAFEEVGAHIDGLRLRAALQTAMGVAQEANRYLDERAPWAAVREDRDSAAETLSTAIQAIAGLATLLQPFLPFSSPPVWPPPGLRGDIEGGGLTRTRWCAGTSPLPEPAALFRKLRRLTDWDEKRRGSAS